MVSEIINHQFLKKMFFATFVAFILLSLTVFPVAAAYNKNLLISNEKFIDHNSMSKSQIQNFLEDEGGELLNNWVDNVNIYQVDSRFQVANNRCLVHKATGMTAAEIIHEAANDWQATYVEWRYQGEVVSKNPADYNGPVDSCSTVKKYPDKNLKTISPRAILATLEKEQSLVSTDGGYSPYLSGYYDPACNVSSSSPYYGQGGCKNNNYKLAWAMGYGVPDTGGKRHQYKGFYMQVMYGSWQLRFNYEHSQGTTDWDGTGGWGYGGPMVGDIVNIDGQNVTILSRATASLYYYTPHLHGNQNFVNIYEQWFGSTNGTITISRNLQYSPSKPLAGNQVAASFIITNGETFPVTIKKMVVAARDSEGNNVNFPTLYDITIQPGDSYEYYQYTTFNNPGEHKLWVAIYKSGVWESNWPRSLSPNIRRERTLAVRQPDLEVIRGLKHSPADTTTGEQKGVSFVVKNNESVPVTIDRLVAAVRDSRGNNVNFPTLYDITIQPGDSYEYYQYNTFNSSGNHILWIAAYTPNGNWSSTWPTKSNSSILTKRTFQVYQP